MAQVDRDLGRRLDWAAVNHHDTDNPHAHIVMRRTFQDLARAAQVKDIVTRAISGHATETMQHHYSTVAADEKKRAIAKVIELSGARKALAGGPRAPGGMDGGMDRSRNRKAARP